MQVARSAVTSSRCLLWSSSTSASLLLQLSPVSAAALRNNQVTWIAKVVACARHSSTVAALATSLPSSSSSSMSLDIEDLHRQAVAKGSNTYADPETGFTVFTEVFHLKRGNCCGCHCRHCPYGWANVKTKPTVESNSSRSYSSGSSSSSSDKELASLKPKKQHPQPTVQFKDRQNGTASMTTTTANSSDCNGTDPKETTKSATGGRKGGTLTSKNVPYTRNGDNGTSQLLNGERRFKTDAAFEAMGTIDELCSFVGVVHAHLLASSASTTPTTPNTTNDQDSAAASAANLLYAELPEWLLEIMSRLFDIGSQVATPPPKRRGRASSLIPTFTGEHTVRLEEWIDQMTEVLPELSSFILPTGTTTAAHLHVARCVCRRAERSVVALQQERQDEAEAEGEDDEAIMERDQHLQRYLNRLSDFFFTAARFVNYCEGQESEIQYRRDFQSSGAKIKQRQRVMAPLAAATTSHEPTHTR